MSKFRQLNRLLIHMTKKIQELIIIGAGPIGLACGIEAQKKNLDYLIFDKGCLVNSSIDIQ